MVWLNARAGTEHLRTYAVQTKSCNECNIGVCALCPAQDEKENVRPQAPRVAELTEKTKKQPSECVCTSAHKHSATGNFG